MVHIFIKQQMEQLLTTQKVKSSPPIRSTNGDSSFLPLKPTLTEPPYNRTSPILPFSQGRIVECDAMLAMLLLYLSIASYSRGCGEMDQGEEESRAWYDTSYFYIDVERSASLRGSLSIDRSLYLYLVVVGQLVSFGIC